MPDIKRRPLLKSMAGVLLVGAAAPVAAFARVAGSGSGVALAASGPDPVVRWNEIMAQTVAPSPAFYQSRAAAMTQLAVFQAVNAILKHYRPYHRAVAAPAGASPPAAAIAAAHRVLVSLHPASAATLDAARATQLAAIPDGQAKTDGIQVGEAAAAAIIAARANDGAAGANSVPYTPGTDPGDWQPTPPGYAPAAFAGWGQVTTFGIRSGSQFRSHKPPALKSGRYARDYNEVKAVGSVNSTARSQDRTDVARLYSLNSAVLLFNDVARQVSVAQSKSLSENARAFALLNMAMTDSLISSMESKFYYNLWRPVTAIQAGDTDGNARTEQDTGWLPLIATPPYSTYPGNYTSIANAAREVFEEAYGKKGHSITMTGFNPLVNVTLHYTKFSQITDDVHDARIYSGLHFRFDQDAGAHMGRQVGKYILSHHLRPANG